MKNIETTRFGEIEIDESRVIDFPEGLLGFPESKRYIILEHKPGSPFLWLQSMTDPDLAFVMTNPFLVKDDYLKDISPEEEAYVKGEIEGEIVVFALVTIPRGKAEATTVNLMGPIVIDSESRTGRQVVLANSGYSHRHPMISK